MPRWWVTEPYINLWAADEPLSYLTGYGERVSFRWSYRQRGGPGMDVDAYVMAIGAHGFSEWANTTPRSTGTVVLTNASWQHNWWSMITLWSTNKPLTVREPIGAPPTNTYVQFNHPWNAELRLPNGGSLRFASGDGDPQHPVDGRPNLLVLGGSAFAQTPRYRLPADYPASGPFYQTASRYGFRIDYPDGSQDVYALAVGNPDKDFFGSASQPGQLVYFGNALLTERRDPQGRSFRLAYERVNGNYQVWYRLKHLMDPEGRVSTYSYAGTNGYNWFQLTRVEDPYGRAMQFVFPYNSPALESIVDAGNLTNSFTYLSGSGWLNTLTTPYGTTLFAHAETFDSGTNSQFVTQRQITINRLGYNQERYRYQHTVDTGVIPASLPASAVPVVGNRVFDSGASGGGNRALNLRNTLHWDARQSSGTTAFASGRARVRHWLQRGDGATVTETLSAERAPSADAQGSVPGLWTFYDYEGKPAPETLGYRTLPACVARRLPGGATQFTELDYHPSSGFPTQRRESYGPDGTTIRTNRYHYSPTNRFDLRIISNALGRATGLLYNTNHQPTTLTNALGELTSLTYDAASRKLMSLALPSTLTGTFAYYAGGTNSPNSGFLTNFAWSTGAWWSYSWSNGLPRTISNHRGLTVTNTWDALNRLTSVWFPDHTYLSNVYDRLDLVAVRDRLGHWTRFAYDGLQHLTHITNTLDKVTTLGWCGCGALESLTDALNQTTLFYYDNAGRLTKTDFADASQAFHDYDAAGRLWQVRDGIGRWQAFSYNNQGLVTSASNAVGRLGAVVFDPLDRAVQVTDANAVTVTNIFNALGQMLKRAWPGGGTEEFVWDATGLRGYINQNQERTWFDYYPDSTLRFLTTPRHDVYGWTRDPVGEITSIYEWPSGTNGQQIVAWERDAYGRVLNKKDNAGQLVWTNAYDANRNLTVHWTPEKGLTQLAYDPLGNLTNVATVGQASRLSLAYDARSQLRTIVSGIGTNRLTNTFSYTKTGQLESEDGPFPNDTVTYGYTSGHRTALGLGSENWSYGYDSLWRLTNLLSSAGAFGYDYGNPASGIRSLAASISLPNRATITNHFDFLGRFDFTALLNRSGHVLDGYTYAHDALGLRTNLGRDFGLAASQVAIGYDAIGELTSWSAREVGGALRLQEQLGYAYDPAGNLLRRTNNALVQSFASNGRNELTNLTRTGALTVSGVTPGPAGSVAVNGQSAALYADFTWASASGFTLTNGVNAFTIAATRTNGGSVTNTLTVTLPASVALQYDRNGNLTNDGWRRFEYDADNQLTAITATNAWRTEFVYDGLNRKRLERDYKWLSGAWSRTNETRYVYDGMLVLQERDANNAPLVTYTRGPDLSGSLQGAGGIGGLLARTDHSTTPLLHAYYHADGAGNITALTDQRGDISARYLYDPYGRLLGKWGPLADANRYRFSSKEWQPNGGLYYYGFRFYDPNLQRWLNQDPIGEAGGINLYGFVGNNPLSQVDPLGLSWINDVGDWELRVLQSFKEFFTGQPGYMTLQNADVDRAGTGRFTPYRDQYGNDVTSDAMLSLGLALPLGVLMGPERESAELFIGATRCRRIAGLAEDGAGLSKAAKTAPEATGFLGSKGFELKNLQAVRNTPEVIDGRNFSAHALDQMQNRGIMPSVVENTLKQGTSFPGNTAGTTGFFDAVNNVRVIVNSQNGTVVTVIRGAP